MNDKISPIASTAPTTMFVLDGMPYMPHYTRPCTYVAPGGATMSEKRLVEQRATAKTLMLWPRRWAPSIQSP